MPTTTNIVSHTDAQLIDTLSDEIKSLIYYGLASLKRDVGNTHFAMERDHTISEDLASFYNTVNDKISNLEAILLTNGKDHLSLFQHFANHKAFK